MSHLVSQKIIELTGPPGSGKTTFTDENYPDKHVLLGGMPISYNRGKRILYSFLLIFYAILTGAINLVQILWLVKKSLTYDERLFVRINALRNSMIKFGYIFFKSNVDETMVIDEGISHIPFILGLTDKEINDFVKLFYRDLSRISIIFIDSVPKEILEKRIVIRGHKRVRTREGAIEFVVKNFKIAEQYKRALVDAGLEIRFV